jgi:hypothetical protein
VLHLSQSFFFQLSILRCPYYRFLIAAEQTSRLHSASCMASRYNSVFIRTSYLPNMAVETAYFVSGRRQLSSQVTPSHAMRRKWKYDTSTRSSAVRLENLELESTHVTLLATLYCFQHSLMPVILRAHFHPTCNRHERQGGVLLLAPSCALRVHHLLNHRN